MSGGIHNRTFFHQSFRSRSALRSRIRQNLTNRSYGREYGPTGSTRISAVSATYFLIALNTGVFAGWVYAQATQEQRLLRTLRQNFTLSWQNWREGRQWTILTSAFSHANFVYFAFNMLTFSAFGIMLSWVPGIGAFHVLALSLGSGIAGSIAWLYQKQMPSESGMGKIIGPFGQGAGAVRQSARGASGMVVGVGAPAACLMPWAKVGVFFIPVPLWVATVGFAALDTYYLNSDKTPFAHASHLGGALGGVAYYLCFLRGYGGIWMWMRMRGRL
ncbi:hypothetical protein LTR94_000625 [Friedmanniomyces endolithicus]|nr:hypothetical protein LTR94_000625 [Friedmanniomyces endolithicus]